MTPPRLLALCLLAAYLALGGACFGQTIRTLGYNTTNNTVAGPTNASALTFTNSISVSAPEFRANNHFIVLTNLVEVGKPLFFTETGGDVFQWEDAATTPAIARSNLFGSAGISTNIQIVRVGGTTNTLIFSNGILHSITTP